MKWAVLALALAVATALWIAGLTWCPDVFLAVVFGTLVAIAQIWRVAARPTPSRPEQPE